MQRREKHKMVERLRQSGLGLDYLRTGANGLTEPLVEEGKFSEGRVMSLGQRQARDKFLRASFCQPGMVVDVFSRRLGVWAVGEVVEAVLRV